MSYVTSSLFDSFISEGRTCELETAVFQDSGVWWKQTESNTVAAFFTSLAQPFDRFFLLAEEMHRSHSSSVGRIIHDCRYKPKLPEMRSAKGPGHHCPGRRTSNTTSIAILDCSLNASTRWRLRFESILWHFLADCENPSLDSLAL